MYKGRIKHIHFIGIGGSGMSGIAEVLFNLGYKVTGSDVKASDTTGRLERLGITIFISHKPENINGSDVVVYSSAVKKDNPEVVFAKEKLIPVIPRAEMLAELMRMKYGIAIAGTHGKTTTTSMIATILGAQGMDPTVVIGGKLNSIGSNARLGKGEFLVAEADESDGSFLKLSPTIAVVTNIDREHMDHYKDMDEVKATYLTFINKIPFYGCAILCLDHPNIQGLIPRITRRHITYGLTAQADFSARDIETTEMKTSFDVWRRGNSMGRVMVKVPGEHNVYNALAAIAVAMELDIGFEQAKDSIANFSGVERRFHIKGVANGITIVDDYGHHPVEIKATLKAAKDGWKQRVVAVFQPHRYSRTQDLFQEFLSAFNDADMLVLTDIYAAGEEKIPGISSEILYNSIKTYGHRDVVYIPDKKDIPDYLNKIAKPGDMVITLGAGDIWQVGEEIIQKMSGKTRRTAAGVGI
ncbi:MAG: UDP-N-acetylmuramate--L-alanine ligase [Deltaproteobacteria bacterium RIFCSPLOWO2_12_FULL_43_16]|nr:MAG: UDP-N-acetylmuramate--L-alanine ligase [Deltaproteobacteria bacterium GWA2_43_19]OGQ10884.1 MAG: UDP-N-acetylmuramate--L-alanine ligase [Deltaproteobacteria bacterium RIFCSPHIGHO2_02_FULL_43_33]OGQ59977.1 MAG: UDP-N-acetylmuramate--L-alanine ligase [Deltaproteobacteria bacterium RIFCSPLOWO2_12_FULL_43_16]HBR16101.1 UDP-N-acetylmuramate--L-alanine ligase [Deltaproteobacteria bacterium]